MRPHLRGGEQYQEAGKRDEQADDNSADGSPTRLADSFLPARGSAAPNLATAEICPGSSIFFGRLDRTRLRAGHDRRDEVVSPRCCPYAVRAAVSQARPPRHMQVPCERLADRISVMTCEASALNSAPHTSSLRQYRPQIPAGTSREVYASA